MSAHLEDPVIGPCPFCAAPMEYGDEDPEERCCNACAAKVCDGCGSANCPTGGRCPDLTDDDFYEGEEETDEAR